MRAHGQSDEVLVLHVGRAPHFPVPRAERVYKMRQLVSIMNSFDCTSEPLDLHTGHDEVVQRQPPGPGIVFGEQVLHESRREAVAHLLESCKGGNSA